jgi:hypothetical protein
VVTALIITEIVIVLASVLIGRFQSSRTRIETMLICYSTLAGINGGITLLWLTMIAFRGVYPSFSLLPLIVSSVVLSPLALRAYWLLRKQGTSPA